MEEMRPIVLVNLKTYKSGRKQLELAKAIESVDKKVILAAPATDLYLLSRNTSLRVFSEHVDPFFPGRNTGFILPESVKAVGAKGVLLNHSEHPLKKKIIRKSIEHCKKLGLKTFVFAKNLREAKKIERFLPDFIIYEPAELVAGKKSVVEANPEVIEKMSREVKTPFLVGAGIHSKEDIDVSLRLGARGVAFSSVITKAKSPKKKLRELLGKNS